MLNAKINTSVLEGFGSPKMKVNREYLLSKKVASELNTYLGFSPFPTFSDVLSEDQRSKMISDPEYQAKYGVSGVRSIFNKSGAVLLGGDSKDPLKASNWRVTNNAPLIDTPDNRKKMRQNTGCTIRELVEASEKGVLGSATYSYSDFMYCKYLGTMPNSYLITLRRFPTPVDDYISSAGIGSERKGIKSSNPLPIGEMITWLNTSGNNIDSILTYSVSMPFEEKKADIQTDNKSGDHSDKPLNAASALFDKTYRDQYQKGMAGSAINKYVGKLFPVDDPPYTDLIGWRDQNKVYGPVDAVKKTYYRSDAGIDFNQSFKLVFEYELRSYNGINGKQAMLDLISNILNVTYTTGTFWGGGYIGTGAHQNNIFANLNIMKTGGGFTNFIDAFTKDASSVKSSVKSKVKANGGVVQTIKNFLNDLGGMLLGGMLNKLGRPQKSQVASLLSPAPTGLWHVTIGNPFHPIMSLGNMILRNTTITHIGPLGLDDFPTGLKVECDLERGKPRDLRGIEMIYMNGNDRIYHSMGPKIFDMYTHAQYYKDSGGVVDDIRSDKSGLSDFYVQHSDVSKINSGSIKDVNEATPAAMKKTLSKYFGTDDTYNIYVQASEQEYGAWAKKKVSTGDTKARNPVGGGTR